MGTHKGMATKAPNGATYFHHDDINECRKWLRSQGLELKGTEGWTSDTRRGLLSFNDGYYAACWRRTDNLPHADCLNVIGRAARQDDIDAAAWILMEALGVATGDLAGYHLPTSKVWATLNQRARLAHIGDWLQEEALSLIPDDEADVSKAEFHAYGRPENA